MRRGLVIGACAIALLAGAGLSTARAQTPTPQPNQLTPQLLTADALPGWMDASDVSTTTPQGLTIAERVFAPANGGRALIAVAVLLPPNGTSADSIAPQLQDGTLLQDLANGAAQNSLADFALTGPQGIGEQDQSATFTATTNGQTLQLAADIALRDGEVEFAVYGEDASQIDAPTALNYTVNVALLQDAKVQSVVNSG